MHRQGEELISRGEDINFAFEGERMIFQIYTIWNTVQD